MQSLCLACAHERSAGAGTRVLSDPVPDKLRETDGTHEYLSFTAFACLGRCPDVAKVKPKMIYASSKEELKKRLVGLACEIQGSDQGDVEYQEVSPGSSKFLLASVTSRSYC